MDVTDQLRPAARFDRRAQHERKREAVVRSAAAAFRRHGYHNTSMTEIAEQLGLKKAALYYYVKNKEEILYLSHLHAYDAMDAILEEPLEDSGLDRLEGVFRRFVSLLTETGVSVLTDVDSLSGAWREDVLARRHTIEDRVVALVERGQADGSIRAGDARLHTFFFMGALNWLNAWFQADGRLDAQTIVDHFAHQMRHGIAT